MGEGKRVQKKEITAGTTVKAVITGYIAYGVLVGFIVFMVGLAVNWAVSQIPNANYKVLSVSLPVLGVFFLYFIMHGVCKLSIYDVFSKCKTNNEGLEKICTRLNLFILIFIAVSVISVVGLLTMNLNNERRAIVVASYQYSTIHSQAFTSELTNEMLNNYQEQRTNSIVSTIILEIGIAMTSFSLIPYQKKLIEEYNEK